MRGYVDTERLEVVLEVGEGEVVEEGGEDGEGEEEDTVRCILLVVLDEIYIIVDEDGI